MENGKKWKIMMFIVATNAVASRPPERRLTGTPTACANWKTLRSNFKLFLPPPLDTSIMNIYLNMV